MLENNRAIIEGAARLAAETSAEAVILAASLPEERALLQEMVGDDVRVLTAVGGRDGGREEGEVLVLPEVRLRRRGRAKIALLEAVAGGYLQRGQRVVVVSGNPSRRGCELDTIALVELDDEEEDLLGSETDAPLDILRSVADASAFDALLGLCVELGREGKEGKNVGLLVTLGDHDAVLEYSAPLVLNPFEGHPEEERSVLSAGARRALREFSGMDGAFVLRSDGVIVAAGRYLEEIAPEQAVPSGLGARHRAAAGITAATRCLAFVVSESTGDTRVFGGGRLLMTIEKND